MVQTDGQRQTDGQSDTIRNVASVCLSRSNIVSKRLNISLHFLQHMVAQLF